jgi:hypothetical protein
MHTFFTLVKRQIPKDCQSDRPKYKEVLLIMKLRLYISNCNRV